MTDRKDRKEHPFISSRSPSYARAREEQRHPSPAPDPVLVASLIRAAHTEQAAANQYEAVASHPNAPEGCLGLASFHSERASRLREILLELGASAGPAGDVSSSQLRVDFSDMSFDTSTEALDEIFSETEDVIRAIFDTIAELDQPDALRAELARFRDGFGAHSIEPDNPEMRT